MRVLMLTALMLTAACGQATDAARNGAADEAAPAYGSMSAPVPDDVTTRITDRDAGGTVSVTVGEKIAVALIGVPTAGYIWSVERAPDFLEAAGDAGGPTSTAQLEPGFAGGNHWEVFFFNVVGEGAGELALEQRRPWEDATEPPAGSFSVTIVASAQ